MARKATKKRAASARPKAARGKAGKSAPKAGKASAGQRKQKSKTDMSAADALSGLLESPLVAEVIAAGAAAALATLTQQALSKKSQGGTKEALKLAAKAAASAMGTRLAMEIKDVVDSGKRASGEAG